MLVRQNSLSMSDEKSLFAQVSFGATMAPAFNIATTESMRPGGGGAPACMLPGDSSAGARQAVGPRLSFADPVLPMLLLYPCPFGTRPGLCSGAAGVPMRVRPLLPTALLPLGLKPNCRLGPPSNADRLALAAGHAAAS